MATLDLAIRLVTQATNQVRFKPVKPVKYHCKNTFHVNLIKTLFKNIVYVIW
jgi:hypothetical protein